MVKVVQAAGYELSKARTRILELEEQNTKLKLDILELESRLAKYEPLGSSSTSLVQVSRNKTVTKRYQQATVASQNRSATPEKHPIPPSSESTVVISGTKYTYDNGVLVTRRPTSSGWYEDVYRYQQNTVSTWKKKKRQLKRPKSSDEVLEDDNGLDRGGDTMAASDSDWSVPMPAQEVDWNDPKFYRGPSEYEPPLHIRALKKRSGLHESGWLK
ncbi:hypothetical protein MGN70_004545 [Eutypa lata]|nr:hypothetical protein MGN70_004545 [Eutypa lata]